MPGPLLTQVLLEEISGKNSAIHAYDKMVWTVRSGFLTLFFGGWGLLLKSLVEQKSLGVVQYEVIGALVVLSVALAAGARAIDINYARRKFRVIEALNGLLELTVGEIGSTLEESPSQRVALLPYLRVSGDSGDKTYESAGYRAEKHVGDLIYFVPLVGLVTGLGGIGIASYIGLGQ